MISKETIAEVREKSEIYDVVSDFLSLKKTGHSYRCKSPFNQERTASFYVIPDKNIFKDFSSGKGGDAITFLMEHERMTFYQAILYLCEKFKIEVKRDESQVDPKELQYQSIGQAIQKAHQYYIQVWSWPEQYNSEAVSYMLRRGFTAKEVRQFKIGFAPNTYDVPQVSDMATLLKAGIAKDNNGRTYAAFRNRILFPIYSISGKVVGLTGRLIAEDANQPKYLHISTSEVFDKSKLLYGLYWSRKKIIEANKCFLIEGPMDYHALVRAQVFNCAATLGTSITENQIKEVKRFASDITIIYDSDKGGLMGAHKALKICLSQDIMPSFVFLPKGEDPDAIVRNSGPEVMRQLLLVEDDSATAMIKMSGYNEAAALGEQQAAIHFLGDTIAASHDSSVRSILSRAVSQALGIKPEVFMDKASSIKSLKPDPSDSMTDPERHKKHYRTVIEEKLAMLLKYQIDSSCYAKVENGSWALFSVKEVFAWFFKEFDIRFTDERFLFLNEMIVSGLQDTQSVVYGLPAVVDYGFYDREPKTMYSTLLKLVLDIALDDAKSEFNKCQGDARDMWQKEIESIQLTIAGIYDEMKSIN